MNVLSKHQLRQTLRAQRKLLSKAEILTHSKKITETLLALPIIKNCGSIALYFPNHHEVDTAFLIDHLHQLGKQCYLPALDINHLLFGKYEPGDPLHLNRYEIPEPIISDKTRSLPSQLDVVLMPLVAFDEEGNRLGMGGGYYDRTFAFQKASSLKKPFLIGLAYQFQQVKQIPTNTQDVSLQMVVTEERVYNIS